MINLWRWIGVVTRLISNLITSHQNMSNIPKVLGSSSDTKGENLAMNKFAANGFAKAC